ncbi:MAG: hypothetical protein Q4D08_03220 [Clostridia bacterium]|nr:hypothetical protein [Clostridia bacterium]
MKGAKALFQRLLQKDAAGKLLGRYLTDPAFRGSVSIWQGMAVNFLIQLVQKFAARTAGHPAPAAKRRSVPKGDQPFDPRLTAAGIHIQRGDPLGA